MSSSRVFVGISLRRFLWGRLTACGPDVIRSTPRGPGGSFLVAAMPLCGTGSLTCSARPHPAIRLQRSLKAGRSRYSGDIAAVNWNWKRAQRRSARAMHPNDCPSIIIGSFGPRKHFQCMALNFGAHWCYALSAAHEIAFRPLPFATVPLPKWNFWPKE